MLYADITIADVRCCITPALDSDTNSYFT